MAEAQIIVLLFALVAALVVIARKVNLPYPVLLVLGGLGLGFVPGLPQLRLEPDIVFYFFLPPLLYPAALFTSWRDFRRNLRTILLLAIGLVLCTYAGHCAGGPLVHSRPAMGGGVCARGHCFAS